MKKIKVKLKHQRYHIFYDKYLLQDTFIVDFCKKLANFFVIITHSNLEFIAKPLMESFFKQNLIVKLFSFENGEKNKTRKTKEYLEDLMLKENFCKDTLIIAIGGGVVIDICGFLASTYMRGISYVAIPTTLLAMVDASIGGKTAVNTNFGKNLVGTIYHPKAVFIDFDVLKTLNEREIKNGYSEMLKHSLIANKKAFFKLLKSSIITEDMIIKSIKIKRKIVQKDVNEKSLRKILNFGHTISHAIEAASNYQIPHGHALAYGLIAESFISYKMNLLSKKELEKIIFFIKDKNLIDNFFSISKEKILEFLKRDKKKILDKNRFILLKSIGKPIIDVAIIKNFIVNSIFFISEGKYVNSSYYRPRSFLC